MSRNYERALPVEQWQQVLENNSPGDLCKVMMTSRYMNSLASWPDLWGDMKLNMRKVKKRGLKELFSIKRFEKIKKMDFQFMEFTSQELGRLWNEIHGTPLKNINFGFVNLSGVPAEVLAMAVAELEVVDLLNTKLTSQQCEAIFRFAAVDCKLKKLDITGNDLSSVDPKSLAKSVAELEEVNLTGTHLTSHQCEEIVRFSANDSKLKKLNIAFNNLSLVDPESLAISVAELEEVNLSVTHLTSDQFQAMFRFSAVDCKLKILNIAGNDMSRLEPESLARSIAKLEEVNIKVTKLTNQQCEAFARFAAVDCNLKKLDISSNDLSSVDPESLARTVANLDEVILYDTYLTSHQIEAIFRHAALDCKLKIMDMDMSDNNLSLVDPKSLTRTVTKFKEMDLSCTDLTSVQCEAIFRFDTVVCKLKKLNMSGHDLSSVDPESLARSVAELEDVNLCHTKLTSQQCQAIFRAAAVDCKLKILNIGRNDLSSVDPDSLARFVAELEEVDLSDAKMTSHQCEAIGRCPASDSKIKKRSINGNDLEEVDLSDAKMTSHQCEAIGRCPASDSKIKKLSINGNDLSTMDPEFLDRVQVDSNFIKLKFVAMDCSEIHFRVKKNIQMGTIKKAYEERTGIPISSLRFNFEGSSINDDHTPRNLGMEKNDAIEVFQNWR